jgi:hypothetical protein
MEIGFAKKKEIRGWIILDSITKLKRNINFTKRIKEETIKRMKIKFKKIKIFY